MQAESVGEAGPGALAPRISRRRGLALRLAAVAVTLAGASAFEHALVRFGLDRGGLVTERGWVFRPRTRAEFASAEFRHSVATSSQGLRDRDFAIPAPPNTLRIAVVGDSLTYGYGVEAEHTWVKQLEDALRARFPSRTVEVVNLGKPGGDPNGYLTICQAALPRLKPDLLLVGLTQGDDVAQLALLNRTPSDARKPDPWARAVTAAFPVTVAHLKTLWRPDDHEVLTALRLQAKSFLSRLDPPAAARYRALDPEVRAQFEGGLLNPILVETACRFPDYYCQTLDPRTPVMTAARRELPLTLKRFDAVCRAQGVPWAVVSVPYGLYVSPEVHRGRTRLGYRMPDDLLRTEVPERLARDCCEAAGVPFVSVTEEIRRLQTPGAYFPLDGHPTPTGHAQFARLLAPRVSQQFATLARARPDGPSLIR